MKGQGAGTFGETPKRRDGQRGESRKTFKKHEKIRRRKDYSAIFQSGQRLHSKNFTVIINRNELEVSRLGLSVSKKVGEAVRRNRIKRLLREFFRLNKSILPASQDIVIIVRKDVSAKKYQDVCRELGHLFSGTAIK
jgi:ribonuclease P protein component